MNRVKELSKPSRTHSVWPTRINNPRPVERMVCRMAMAPLGEKVSNAEIWRNFRTCDWTIHQPWDSSLDVWGSFESQPNRLFLK